MSRVFDAGASDGPMPDLPEHNDVLSDYVDGVYTAGKWIHGLKQDFPLLRAEWERLVTRTVVWTRHGASRRVMVKVPATAQDLVAQASNGLQRNITTVAAARDFVRLYRSRQTQAERTLLLDFLCEASTMYCSAVGSAARFRLTAELYRVWSARHLQADRADPAAEGAPPGSVRVCTSCERDWRGGDHVFCCPYVNLTVKHNAVLAELVLCATACGFVTTREPCTAGVLGRTLYAERPTPDMIAYHLDGSSLVADVSGRRRWRRRPGCVVGVDGAAALQQ